MKKNKDHNFNEELNNLFEKLLRSKNKGIKNIEELKSKIVNKLDKEIGKLYAKKDFIAEMWLKKDELKLQKISVWRKFRKASSSMLLRCFISIPFIYMMIIPALILHVFIEVYHQICFRLYGIPRVLAREYFIFDRKMLPYLNWFEKFNCFYCSYFNCLISYSREIAARTERYWCPIKHSKVVKGTHGQYEKFVDYSDGEALRNQWKELRKFD